MAAAPRPAPEKFVFLLLENFTLIAFACAIEPLRLANRIAGPHALRLERGQRDRRAGRGLERRARRRRRRAGRGRPRRDHRGLRRDEREGGDDARRADLAAPREPARHRDRRGLHRRAGAGARPGCSTGRRCTIHWENRDSFEEDFPEIELSQTVYVIDAEPLHRRRRHRLGRPDAEARRAQARAGDRQPRRRPDDPHRAALGPRRAAAVDPDPDRRAPSQARRR